MSRLQYHVQRIGVERVVVYSIAAQLANATHCVPLTTLHGFMGKVEVLDISQGSAFSGSNTFGAEKQQMHILHLCIHQHIATASWLLHMDADEYLWFKPPFSLQRLLAAAGGYDVIGLASHKCDVRFCLPQRSSQPAQLLVERIPFCSRVPACLV